MNGITSIGIAYDIGRCAHANGLNERPHFGGAQGTVETETHGVAVGDTDDEGVTGLSGQSATTFIDNSARNL